MTSPPPPLPLYYENKSLADMEQALRRGYLRSSGWLESADKKLAVRDGEPVPWFTYGAISFLERELTSDLALFEYGGGQSTLYWAKRLRQVSSIDHDPAFEALLRASLPKHVDFRLVEEGARIPPKVAARGARQPAFTDPERTTQSYRSGQLNQAFQAYGLQVLDYPDNTFDVIIVDGMARNLSTWAAIQHFQRDGFIVFDNSDRDFYRSSYDMLADAGYRRLDFWGMGPINPYEWCTSVFYEHKSFTAVSWFGSRSSKAQVEEKPRQAREGTGILVLGYNRPHHLQAVLESLRLQDRLADTHVWIDGTQGRGEYLQASDRSAEIARRYDVAETRLQRSHLGIEKMMLDALAHMVTRYERVVVLEDDCFPTEGAIDAFEHSLAQVKDRPEVFSAYGHPFGTEPEVDPDFTRFQGWGWAAHSDRIEALLPELRNLFMMTEEEYCSWVATNMTEDIRSRLDRTPGRDVLRVLELFYSWDSATAFLTAQKGMVHRRTEKRVVFNTGISKGIGHFQEDGPFLRKPPFNLVRLEEAWTHFDRSTRPCPADRDSYGLDALDLRIRNALEGMEPGFLIDIGAHDGVTQSNSVLLEADGWRGLLIEANPGNFAKCLKSRPGMIVEHAACVTHPSADGYVTLTDVGLMSMTEGSNLSGQAREDWLSRGEGFTRRPRQEIDVPACTMSSLLDKHGVSRVDLLLLDVEGAELDVLGGLDFTRHAPSLIVAEDAYEETIAAYLAGLGYVRDKVLLERKFTRDCLYRKQSDIPTKLGRDTQ